MLARTKYALVPAIRAQRLARRLAALLAVSTSAQADALGASWAHFGGPWPPFAVFALLSLAAIAMLAGTAHFRSLRRALRVEIAKRLTSETAAEEEKRRLNDILDHSRVGVLLVDRNCRHVDVNRSWSQMFGYRRREVRGKLAARDIAHPEDATALEEHFLGLLAGRSGALTQERRFVRKDGSSFWGLMSTSTVTNKAGGQMWVVAMITDIDAQKRAEQALRESEERLRFITESTQDVVWQLDRELRFTYVNAADERMRGYRRDEVIGRRFDEIVDPAEYPVVEQAMQSLFGQASAASEVATGSFEIRLRCKRGRQLWGDINSTPIHDAFGQIAGFIGVTRDATVRRESHKKLLEQTIRDPLTGLFNRRYLDESLERELARARRENLPLSLIMIDIDHFKQLNDTHGHQTGDEVLKRLGGLIRQGARRADLPCRYGGEEFLLVLPNVAADIAADRAEKWRLSFAQEEIALADGQLVSSTFSAGVATYPEHGKSSEALVRAADQALYTAKHSGRDRVAIAAAEQPAVPDLDATTLPMALACAELNAATAASAASASLAVPLRPAANC